ncbi:transporter [Roseiflexus sp. AH-315-K22]|nr:transporter [Roseiflexus sp. AH-315-K22]
MNNRQSSTVLLATLAANLSVCLAQEAADKSPFTLFNPTPGELRRPMSADRPDATESPYTVDAGAVQLEMSFLEFATSRSGGNRTDVWSAAPINLKVGLTNSTDLQFLFDPRIAQRGSNGVDTDGIGNTGLRLKVNLYGNDTGSTAVAILPFFSFPTGDHDVASDHVEGGIVIPLATELSGGWGLGMQVEFAFQRNATNTGYDTIFAHTAALGHDITNEIAGYIEYIGIIAIDTGDDYSPSLSSGLTYAHAPDLQFDFGVVIGLDQGDTEDLGLFTGVTIRY